jgi:hypothetical protein
MRLTSILFSVLMLSFLAACEEKEEPIAIETTFIEGEITGTFTDGAAFTEPFRFEQVSTDIEKFEETQYGQQLDLVRSQGSSFLKLSLILEDAGLPTEKLSFLTDNNTTPSEFDFFYRKEENASSLIEISGKGFYSTTSFRSMSVEENKTYNLVVDKYNDPVIIAQSKEIVPSGMGGEPLRIRRFQFRNTNGDVIHFSGQEDTPYIFQKIVYADGSTSTDDTLYKNLIYVLRAGIPSAEFKKKTASGDIGLSESFKIIDGSGSILTHTYDLATGRLTFDFTISLAGSSSTNSTEHDLTIAGTFDSGPGKIYLNTTN